MTNSPKIDLSSIMKGKDIINKKEEKKDIEENSIPTINNNTENNIENKDSIVIDSEEDKKTETKHLKIGIKSLKTEQKNEEVKTEKEEKNNENIENDKVSNEVNIENDKVSNEVNIENNIKETTNQSNEKIAKISLGSIKTNKSKDIISEEVQEKSEKNHIEKKTELTETLTESDEKLKLEEKNVLKNENEESNLKKDEIIDKDTNIDEIQAKINAEVDEETEKKLKITKNNNSEENNESEGELFGNYKSDFDGKEEKIIKKIEIKRKNLREKLKEPKTRILLVLSLILITVSIISGLFYLDPENHSINKYKKVITNNINNIKKTYFEKPWINETIKIEEYTFNVLSQVKKGDDKNYNYIGDIYNSKDELYAILNKEVQVKKDEIAIKKAEEERMKKAEEERIKIEQEELKKIEEELAIKEETILNNEDNSVIKTEEEKIAIEKIKFEKEKIKSALIEKFRIK